MSFGPDLGNLFTVVKRLDQGVHSETSLRELLEAVMPVLVPDARATRVYRLSGNKAILQAGTQPGSDVELTEATPHYEAVANVRPVSAWGVWIAPLHISGDVFGLLEVDTGSSEAPSETMPDLMQLAAHLLAPTLQRAFTFSRDLARRDADDALSLAHAQYEASGAIFGSESAVEILKSIHSFTGQVFSQAQLGLIDDPDTATKLRVVAEVDEQGARRTNYERPLDEYPAYEALVALEALTVQDVSEDEFLTDMERERLLQQGVRSLVIVPLVVSQRLTGLICFTHALPVTLSPARLRALRNLGDQLAIVFENRALLRSTAQTLEEVRTLYDLNRAMIGANSPLDILSLLRTYLANDAMAITHTGVRRTLDGTLDDLIRQYLITPSGETIPNTSFGERLGERGLAEMQTFLAQYEETIDLEDNFSGNSDSPLAFLADIPGTRAYINLVIRDEVQVSDIISVFFSSARTFDERTRRLYEAVGDQIAIVLQNQRLLSDSNRRAEQLQRIASFGQSVQMSLDIPDLIQTMLTESTRTLPIDRMSIGLHDRVQDVLRVVAEFEDGTSNISPTGGSIMNRSGSFAGRVWETGEFLHIPDLLISSETGRREPGGLRAMMIGLVRTRDRRYGLVQVGSLRPNAYSETDVAVFQQMVGQLAVALENAEEFAQSQRLAKNEALINDIASQLQQQMDMQRMLNVTLTEVGKALGAKRGRIRLMTAGEAGERQ